MTHLIPKNIEAKAANELTVKATMNGEFSLKYSLYCITA
jgi:hypothetical protein